MSFAVGGLLASLAIPLVLAYLINAALCLIAMLRGCTYEGEIAMPLFLRQRLRTRPRPAAALTRRPDGRTRVSSRDKTT